MRQVIKHRDIRLLNMIRRTDPVIPQTFTPDNIFCLAMNADDGTEIRSSESRVKLIIE